MCFKKIIFKFSDRFTQPKDSAYWVAKFACDSIENLVREEIRMASSFEERLFAQEEALIVTFFAWLYFKEKKKKASEEYLSGFKRRLVGYDHGEWLNTIDEYYVSWNTDIKSGKIFESILSTAFNRIFSEQQIEIISNNPQMLLKYHQIVFLLHKYVFESFEYYEIERDKLYEALKESLK